MKRLGVIGVPSCMIILAGTLIQEAKLIETQNKELKLILEGLGEHFEDMHYENIAYQQNTRECFLSSLNDKEYM